MTRKKPQRSTYRTLFISAEGYDEIGFLNWLKQKRGRRNNQLEITFDNAHGGSNPQIVEIAARSEAAVRICLMDSDRYLAYPKERAESEAKAAATGVEILYSEPSFENLLLGMLSIKPIKGKEKAQLRQALKNKSPQDSNSYDSVLNVDMLRTYGKTNKTICRLLELFELN